MKKVFISICIFILIAANARAQTHQQIQIIDISKGEIVKSVQKNAELQQDAEDYLKGITGVYVKMNPYPNHGFVIKIPLEPMVKNNGSMTL